ncbi:MAG: NYN domain-containing protein [Leptolyngbyaceae cyanobacterium]
MRTDNTAMFDDLSLYTGQEQGRVSVFIDAAHVFYAASTLEIEIDYSKFVPQLVRNGHLLRAYFYTGVNPKNTKQQGFLLWMKRNGYRVITKEIAPKENAEVTRPQRSVDFCVEITTDMIEQAAFCDTVILVSGDGRFSRLLSHFVHSNTRTELISLQSITSERLLNEADSATDFAELRNEIAKRTVTYKRSRFSAA